MSADLDFKNLWQQQQVAPPNMDELLHKLKKFKKAGLKQVVIVNIILLITAAMITFIWYYFQPQFVSTKIGMVFVICAMFSFVLAYNQLFKLYKSNSDLKNNHDYLKELITIKHKQKFLQTTMMQVYFVLLSLGICLYLYEYVSYMPLLWGISIYTLTLVWLMFNWIYLRPKIIKKQQAKLDTWISTFQRITKQLEKE